jgi:nucleotide-binding universal stress UspA family protein
MRGCAPSLRESHSDADGVLPMAAAPRGAKLEGTKGVIMFETIVWATDGSEIADSALPFVTELARAHDSKIVVFHATELFRGGRFAGGPIFADEDVLQAKIEQQSGELREAGFAVEPKTVATYRHRIPQLIADAAVECEAGVIVIGTHGRGIAATALLGSVTKALLHLAPCPVLAIPSLYHPTVAKSSEAVALA